MANERNQKEARARFILGAVMADIAEDEYAIELFRSALERDPTLAAAHIHLGLAYGRQGTYEEMLDEFREAVRHDPLSVRTAVVKEPDEVALIARLLNPPSSVMATAAFETVMPVEYVEAGNLVRTGREQISAGSYEKAIEALECSLRIDPEFPLAISMLSLAYLLLQERSGTKIAGGESMLRAIDPALAKSLFGS